MPLSYILAISCLLTLVVMTVFVVTILVVMRFGQEWVSNLVERFMNPDKKKSETKQDEKVVVVQQPQVASSQALRQRAQSLDFPAPAGGFSSQAAPQANYQQDTFGQAQGGSPQQAARASLRPRDEYPSFNPQSTNQGQSIQPTMPSLSPSRPFQQGGLPVSQPQYPQQPQQGNFGGLPPAQPQYPPQAPQTQQGGFQPLRPQQGNYPPPPQQAQQGGFPPQQPLAPRPPQQGFQAQGLPPQQPLAPRPPQQNFQQAPQQGGYPPQPGFPPPQASQQGGLGDYRPALNNSPRPDMRTQSQRPIRRDNRRQDDTDEGGILGAAGDILDGAGDILDGF